MHNEHGPVEVVTGFVVRHAEIDSQVFEIGRDIAFDGNRVCYVQSHGLAFNGKSGLVADQRGKEVDYVAFGVVGVEDSLFLGVHCDVLFVCVVCICLYDTI